ncbi:MAG: hypothetical protein MJZ81_10685 [Bacteroidales bacterium]|nr:hypothetical protein [Bacteroidales bacterium]
MKNREKFANGVELAKAFDEFCASHVDDEGMSCCEGCPLREIHLEAKTGSVCPISWLDLEYSDRHVEKCPFCGSKCKVRSSPDGYWVECTNLLCRFSSGISENCDKDLEKHNRFERSCRNWDVKPIEIAKQEERKAMKVTIDGITYEGTVDEIREIVECPPVRWRRIVSVPDEIGKTDDGSDSQFHGPDLGNGEDLGREPILNSTPIPMCKNADRPK